MSARWTEEELAAYRHRRGLGPLAAMQRSAGVKISRDVKTDYKAQFEQQMSLIDIGFEREFFFHRKRRWRSDWRVKNTRVLVEFEGGLFKKRAAGHSSVTGILRDIEKYNAATLAGWLVIRITPKHVVSGEALKWVEQAIVLDQLGLTKTDTLQADRHP